MNKKLGILGGMGPLATVEFMLKIISQTPAHNDQEHIPMVVSSVPQIPDRTAFIMGHGQDPYPELKHSFEQLEQSGAECIVIPCNTAHYWYPQLSATSHVHTISIIDSVVQEAQTRRYKTVGLLATTATMKARMYQQKLNQYHIEVIETDDTQQRDVMQGIYEVKAGNVERGKALMLPVFESMLAQGAEAVILGCTEIPVALAEQNLKQPQQCLDSLEILAKCCVDWSYEEQTALAS
ncbi:aspartate/glutamate racemase family protein [Aliivibrio fischeri]|uniref:aspartate/glutamate racemase family protein n=1 Tax=Aliivibrio fischeri TaxID=668 RepID=UPI00080DEB7E|nr:amino acid racemase [Aliivibrio fischeri]OCH43969.1 aspartate racemase [Aliivibrio fischeri]